MNLLAVTNFVLTANVMMQFNSVSSWRELNLHIYNIEFDFTILPNNTIETIHFGTVQHNCCLFASIVTKLRMFFIFDLFVDGCQDPSVGGRSHTCACALRCT